MGFTVTGQLTVPSLNTIVPSAYEVCGKVVGKNPIKLVLLNKVRHSI